MSLVKSVIAAGVMSLAFAGHALADFNVQPWDIKERTGYVVMMDGTMKTVSLGDKGMTMLMKRAKKVPHGMVFFMNNGQLYMVNASGMFDRSGNAKFFN